MIQTIFWILGMLLGGYLGNIMTAAGRPVWNNPKQTPLDAIQAGLNAIKTPGPLSTNKIDLIGGAVGILCVGCAWAYQWAEKQIVRRDGEEQGSAGWAKPKDMEPYTDKDIHKCLRMTKTEALSMDGHKTHRNLNVLVIGASGAGKTRGYVIPNLKNLSESTTLPVSFAVTDPKGELYHGTAKTMEQRGYKVKCLNLVDMPASTRFNPLKYIRKDAEQENLMSLCDNILDNMNGKDAKKDFWFQTAQALLRALVAFVYYYKQDATLNDAIDLLGKMQASEDDENAVSDVDALFIGARAVIKKEAQNPDAYDEQAKHALQGLAFAAAQYRAYEQAAGETKKSIITTLANTTASMHATDVRALLSSDDMSLEEIGRQREIVYVCVSDTNTTFNWLAAIFYQSLFETTVYEADHTEGGMLPVQLHCFLDEFANIGKIPGFDILIATIRSRGISVSVIIQTLAQLKGMYKDSWETLTANCDSKLFLGGNDETTTKWMSDMLGKQTITVRGNSENKGSNGSYSESESRQGRLLMAPDELGRMDNTKCVYLLRGLRPYLSTKIGF